MTAPDVSIIIVSFNTRDLLEDCLASIFHSRQGATFEVIVVDNHSTDGTVTMVQRDFPQVKIMVNKDNVGFAKANNQGARVAAGKYLWLLNSDTLIQPDTLPRLFEAMEKNKAYLASCRLTNKDGTTQPQGGALPTLMNTFTWMTNLDALPFIAKLIPPYQDRREANGRSRHAPNLRCLSRGWLGGTALMIRRDAYMALGGLDEHIFMYGEDVELCFRAAKGDIPVHYFPDVSLTHLGQGSGNSEKSILGEFAGLKYLFKKHHRLSAYNILRLWLKIGALQRIILYTLKGNRKLRNTYAKAFTLA